MREFIKVSVEPSIILQQVEVSKKTGARLTDNEQLAFDTFKEATMTKARRRLSVAQENHWLTRVYLK